MNNIQLRTNSFVHQPRALLFQVLQLPLCRCPNFLSLNDFATLLQYQFCEKQNTAADRQPKDTAQRPTPQAKRRLSENSVFDRIRKEAVNEAVVESLKVISAIDKYASKMHILLVFCRKTSSR